MTEPEAVRVDLPELERLLDRWKRGQLNSLDFAWTVGNWYLPSLLGLARERETLEVGLDAANDNMLALIRENACLAGENQALRDALAEVAEGAGPFSRDPLKHAANVIQSDDRHGHQSARWFLPLRGARTVTHRELTGLTVQSWIARHAEEAGGCRALARKWKVSAAYISDLTRGNRQPGPPILAKLGLEKVVVHTVTYRLRSAWMVLENRQFLTRRELLMRARRIREQAETRRRMLAEPGT